jgi:cysteine desulfurase
MSPDAHIYLDHAATSPIRAGVRSAMEQALGAADFNPASQHAPGRAAQDHLEEARRTLAGLLDVDRRRIVFTGGGTASDNLAVLGFARAHRGESPRILASALEHKAVLGAAGRAAREGAEVERIPVDGDGVVRMDALADLLAGGGERPTLVSLMWANNEVGSVQPVAEAAALAREHGARLHTDAVQAYGKLEVSADETGVDLLSATAHKLGGPVGIGLLYVAEGVELEPLMAGGTQEGGLWPGTQDPVGAVGFAEAARLAREERPEALPRWRRLRDELASLLREGVPGLTVRGEGADHRLPHVLNVGIPGVDQSALLVSLDMEGVALSSGSACSSGAVEPSHVLEAMGAAGPGEAATLRFSFGPETSEEEVRTAADAVCRVVERLGGRDGARDGSAGAAP